MSIAINVENVSKRFRINHLQSNGSSHYRTLRESLSGIGKGIVRNLRSGAALGQVEDFWALRDVCFQVSEGEVVGLIGRNGAGKSTLLKILTRITEPTSGRALMRGRVGSLLEVGTGFHPELSGRENVFLNGSILGMPRSEIHRKFDAIVDFSGIERFIDTPVKRYSSGMKVRLGFAVAAHLNLDILLIDEVLSVGDAEFRRKCLGKMDDVAQSGRTVLFVSHNLAALQNICPRSILLDAGRRVMDGPSSDVVQEYLSGFGTVDGSRNLEDYHAGRAGTGRARILGCDILKDDGDTAGAVVMGESLCIRVRVYSDSDIQCVEVGVGIFDAQGGRVCGLNSADTAGFTVDLGRGRETTIDCILPEQNLMPGPYRLNLSLKESKDRSTVLDFVPHAVGFQIVPGDVYKTGKVPVGPAAVYLPVKWRQVDGQEAADRTAL